MANLRRMVAGTLCALLFAPSFASAQAPPKAGIVTTLEGNVTATRAAAPPVALRFKDDVFLQDTVTTGDQSLARMLLGGKAVVTVRERSVLTITEIPGRSLIEIDSGKFALAVARERMRPGEVIEIRTPNAIAGVRGSVIVTEVESAPGARVPASSLYVLTGSLSDAQPRDPTTRLGVGTPQNINPMQQFRVVGLAPTVLQIRPDQLGAIRAGLQPRGGPKHKEAQNQQQLTVQQVQTATTLAQGLIGPGGAEGLFASNPNPSPGPSPTTAEPTVSLAPITPVSNPEVSDILVSPPVTFTSGTFVNDGVKIPLVGGILVNPGFETGDFTGWSLSGAGAVLKSFGAITPREGNFFALVHTGSGSIPVSGCGTGKECTKSTLTQNFSVSSIVTISARAFLMSNEFPTFTGSGSAFTDTFKLQLIDSTSKTFTLFETTVNDLHEDFVTAGFTASAAGFTLSSSGGIFEIDLPKTTLVVASGSTQLVASVSNVSDSSFDSGFLADAVLVTQDPPLFFIAGGSFERSGPLQTFTNETRAFDSLLVACCGASVTLGGPALEATDSNLVAPFGAVHAIQGGRITSTSSGPLVRLNGGNYTLGTISSVFSAAGMNADGSDEPLRHGGTWLDATNANVMTSNVMLVDRALLAATAPLLNLKNSTLTATASPLDLSFRSKVSSLGPVVALDGSHMAVLGSLVNLRGGSSLFVNGDLLRLSNGSSLSLLNGPLASVSGNSSLNVSGSLVSFTGAGNVLNISNNLCSVLGCSNVGGLNVALTGGATAANVNISNPIKGAGTVNIGAGAAAVVISGAGSKVNVGN